MKRYLKYKNFTPCEFVELIDNKTNVKSNKLISILLILNIIVFPNSIKKILNKGEDNGKRGTKVEDNINPHIYIGKENIELYLNQINSGISNMKIQNNNGTIEAKDKNEVFKIEINEKIKIKSITKNNNNLFLLEVEL